VEFEWDNAKDSSNQRKHGVSFSEATELFTADQEYLEIFDSGHSDTEDRFIAIGEIRRGVAVVVFTERDDDTIRIIGARLATRPERDKFYGYLDEQL